MVILQSCSSSILYLVNYPNVTSDDARSAKPTDYAFFFSSPAASFCIFHRALMIRLKISQLKGCVISYPKFRHVCSENLVVLVWSRVCRIKF